MTTLQEQIEKLEAANKVLREACEFYDSLKWKPRIIQWWPFTRSDKISKKATEALTQAQRIMETKENV